MKCKNCGAELVNEHGFCQNCGARVIHDRISLRFLFQEFLDKVLSYDNKLMKTFIHLFTKPEDVIDGYIQGVRKKYLNPVSYLLISMTLSGIYLYFFKDAAIESFSAMQQLDPDNPMNNNDLGKEIFETIYDYPAFFTAINIPFYALVSWLVFLNKKKYNFYEHIVIYLYGISQVSILSFIVVLPIYFINERLASDIFMYASFSIFIYAAYILIRIFKLSFGQFILKTLLFSAISSVIFIIITVIFTIAMFLGMTPEQLQKIKQQQDSIYKSRVQVDTLKVKNDTTKTKTLTPR